MNNLAQLRQENIDFFLNITSQVLKNMVRTLYDKLSQHDAQNGGIFEHILKIINFYL